MSIHQGRSHRQTAGWVADVDCAIAVQIGATGVGAQFNSALAGGRTVDDGGRRAVHGHVSGKLDVVVSGYSAARPNSSIVQR